MTGTPLRIGAFGGYYGDRRGALSTFERESTDFLIADYLAELTMLVLGKNMARGKPGYATGFVEELQKNLQWIHANGVRVVTNAGGLDPVGCADAIRVLCANAGVEMKVAAVYGDNIKNELSRLADSGERLVNLDTGEGLPVAIDQVITANAYLGAGGIVAALRGGAQIVVTGRVTDAALVLGPAMAHFEWSTDDYDALAGAVAVGHAIECGAQVTGGNYCFFDREGKLGVPGMPIAEISADGSSVITKVAETGGVVNRDTVTAQMVYEVTSSEYHNPDVVVDLTSVQLDDLGNDRVRMFGVRGLPPTPWTKLSLSYHGGYRNQMTLGLTGPNEGEKIAWITDQLRVQLGEVSEFDEFDISVIGGERFDPDSYGRATSWLVVAARDSNSERVGREQFSDRIVELGISSVPGLYFTSPPTGPRQVGIQWPCLISKESVDITVDLGDGEQVSVPWAAWTLDAAAQPARDTSSRVPSPARTKPEEPSRPIQLGNLLGARSGDKAGIANLGVWAQDDETYRWLADWLTTERLAALLPEVGQHRVARHEFPNLRALNFVVYDFLGRGVSATLRFDAQAKGLGEYFRARVAHVPSVIADRSHGRIEAGDSSREQVEVS
ncbi:acyclic terpene utilization AtuA family protein [Nakamurella leprariae]|uniref:DUF1446 domain-containing protein n=1 Tax=Nakamurella leprariae TaxID=2803911 RepID=A0A939BUN2_9ACTN|nr:acyclic terpene utilization AtuA family protein [Nakamurella leprariae]MBM9465698.1 DUF1446 domain-containing protein [Nakamurella leprariae]